MKSPRLFAVLAAVSLAPGVRAVEEPITSKKPMRERPPVFTAPPASQPAPPPAPAPEAAAAPTSAATYQQSPGSGRSPLVNREQAQAVLDRFKKGYAKLGNPRIVLSVNRELVDETSGLKLSERKEKVDSVKSDFTADPTLKPGGQLGANVTVVGNVNADHPGVVPGKGTTDRVTSENSYKQLDTKPPTLADKQTVRDVERLFGRPLRSGGARLADQRVASQLLSGHQVQDLLLTAGGVNAARDREALMKVADVVIEVLISSRPLTVPGVAGDAVYQAPDIQATAIRLSDAQVLGQASATDILGPDRYAGKVVRNYDIREITEATALALMEDMMQGVE